MWLTNAIMAISPGILPSLRLVLYQDKPVLFRLPVVGNVFTVTYLPENLALRRSFNGCVYDVSQVSFSNTPYLTRSVGLRYRYAFINISNVCHKRNINLTPHRSVNGIGAYLAYHGYILLITVSNQSGYGIRVRVPFSFTAVKIFLQRTVLTFSINKVSQNSIN